MDQIDKTMQTFRRSLLAWVLLFSATTALAQNGSAFCGERGVWVQILGSGGAELDDGNSPSSYLVWLDNKARLLVDTAPGSSVRFDNSGAKFNDLDAIVFTHLHADHAGDFPAFVDGSLVAGRERPLPVLGPDGDDPYPDTKKFIKRLIGPDGAFPYLADFLTYKSSGGYKIDVRNVPSTGRRRWSRFGTDNIRLTSMPVHHGGVPAVAWRVEVDDAIIVFAGDLSNQKNVLPKFAKGADALIVHHAIPDTARGTLTTSHITPTQIGQIAAQAEVRMLILGHRTHRTRGRETQSREAIEANYTDPLIFANDLECWGL